MPRSAERSPRSRKGNKGERGLALLTVLWVLSLLAVVAAGLVAQTRTELQITQNMKETARAKALADAGIFLAIPRLLDPAPESQWPADGRAHAIDYGGGTIRIVVQDEGGKIDLNNAPDEILAGLLAVLGVGPDEAARLVDAIADWKDADDLRRVNGAERDDYRRAGLAWVPRNGPFEAVEELRLVFGMNSRLYERILPFVTIESQSSRVNPAPAPAEVLLARPGANADMVARLLAARARSQAVLPTLTGLEQFFSPSPPRAVTVRAEGRTPGGGFFLREAVIAITGKRERPYEFRAWRQGRSVESPEANASAPGISQ